jgi:hypothetical protein
MQTLVVLRVLGLPQGVAATKCHTVRSAESFLSQRGKELHCLFGLTLASDWPFANQLLPGSGAPELVFTCVEQPPYPPDGEKLAPFYESLYRTETGESVLSVYRLEGGELLHFPGVADFYVKPGDILYHLPTPPDCCLFENYFLGTVLSFYLEQHNIRALHCSAVVAEDRAIGFLADSRSGKSTLAAAFVQAGHPLLADDILAVREREGAFFGEPGYPQMRLWPGEAEHFLGQADDLPLVHPRVSKRRAPVGSFSAEAKPLGCLYAPERRPAGEGGAEIEITPLPPAQALLGLVRNSFVARLVTAMGWEGERLDALARMVRQTPIRRLSYPSGLEYLPAVREAILSDLRALLG